MNLTIGKEYETSVYLVQKDDSLEMLSEDVKDYAINTQEFTGKLNESFIYLGPNTENLVVIGLGKAEELTKDNYVQAAKTAANILDTYKTKNFSFYNLNNQDALQGAVEGVLQHTYQFDQYKKEKSEEKFENVSFLSDMDNAEELLQETQYIMDAVNITRDLVNTPANDLYPETLANEVEELFRDENVNVKIYDKKALQELGAEALLAVSQGSVREPRLIVAEYLPLGPKEPAISLVGKGVTYDSGGYAIKNAAGMSTMMSDMAGAGAMIGALHAIVKNKLQQNVIAVIGATENLISGEAFKNGDIINSLKGTTIEVLNTDAEGRLLLADALYYAATEISSKYIIDAATLTGAAIAALGPNITATMTNAPDLLEQVTAASKITGEDFWQLPIVDQFREKIKGNHADLSNIATNFTGAGTSTAGAFLEHFVEDIPWVHLDIAGPSYSEGNGNKYLPKGASGIPVKTLYQFVKDTVK